MSSATEDQTTVKPTEKAKPTKRSLLDEIVEIKVGPLDKTFKLHKGLLCEKASYFKTVYQSPGDWKEKREGLILKDVDPAIFQHFILWLYFGNIIDDDETMQSVKGMRLMQCYFFADERGIPGMQNQVIDTLLEKIKTTKVLFVKHQRLIWENTPDGSPLRRLLVDALAMTAIDIPEMLQTEENQALYNKSFIADVLIAKCKHPITISGTEFVKRRCEYHIHDEVEPKCP
ncbi:MAG: hypothetical protein Q9199_004271 [Rusavskia elegans]